MRFEGADDALSSIATVDVGGDQLELGTPFFCDDTLILSAGFIVQDLQVHLMAQSLQTSHDCVVGFEAVAVFVRRERTGKNDIGVTMVGNHDILIAASGSDWETPGVVGVELADVLYTKMQFAGLLWGRQWQGSCTLGLRGFGLGGAQTLTLLNHMAQDSFIGGGIVLGGVLECETWP